MYKTHPYYPKLDSFDPELSLSQEDISFFVKNGFNVVRLYVAWQGVEPTKGQYNDTYLSVSKINSVYNSMYGYMFCSGSCRYC